MASPKITLPAGAIPDLTGVNLEDEGLATQLKTTYDALPTEDHKVLFLFTLATLIPSDKRGDLPSKIFDFRDRLRKTFGATHLDMKELKELDKRNDPDFIKKVRESAVHDIDEDTINGILNDDHRHVFIFRHHLMKDEPLAVLYIAETNGLAGNIQNILSGEASLGEHPDTAIFYSILSNPALASIPFGADLIKEASKEIVDGNPEITQFSTLSPIPGFVKWLDAALKKEISPLNPAEKEKLAGIAQSEETPEQVLARLVQDNWHKNKETADKIQPILSRLCMHYLLNERRQGMSNRALNSVAHFHLSNGARVEVLNAYGNLLESGIKESAGFMVNYLYPSDENERKANRERYTQKGGITVNGTEGLYAVYPRKTKGQALGGIPEVMETGAHSGRDEAGLHAVTVTSAAETPAHMIQVSNQRGSEHPGIS
jgi:malonyl-CoA decarboxylase